MFLSDQVTGSATNAKHTILRETKNVFVVVHPFNVANVLVLLIVLRTKRILESWNAGDFVVVPKTEEVPAWIEAAHRRNSLRRVPSPKRLPKRRLPKRQLVRNRLPPRRFRQSKSGVTARRTKRKRKRKKRSK